MIDVVAKLVELAGPRLRVIELRPAPEPLVVGAAYEKRKLCPASQRFAKLLRAMPKTARRV